MMVGHPVRERLPLAGWVSLLLLTGLGLIVRALWPSLQDTFADLQESLPDGFATVLAGADMSTPSGWANAQMLSIIAPGAVNAATKSTAGEEESKTAGMFLAAPISRTSFIVARALAVVVLVTVTSAAVGVGLGLGSMVGDMDLGRRTSSLRARMPVRWACCSGRSG